MNKRIATLREVVTKVTKLLAGKGIEVTQRGAQAYVRPSREGIPEQVNIPYIADDATDDFILAIQGFIDHEVGHVLFTDFPVKIARTAGDPRLHMIWNIVEDPMIERLMGSQFPGARHNIELLGAYFVEKITKPALKKVRGKSMATFQVLIVPCIRAMSGQRVFHEFMLAGGHYAQPLIALMIEKMSADTKARLPLITTTAEACAIADELYAIIHPKPIEIDADKADEAEGEDDATTFDTAVIKDPPPAEGKGEGETGEGESKDHEGDKETEDGAGEPDGGSEEDGAGDSDHRERDDAPGGGEAESDGLSDPDNDDGAEDSDDAEPAGSDRDGGEQDDAEGSSDAAPTEEDLEGEDADGGEQDGDAGASAGSPDGDHEDAGEDREAGRDDDGADADDGADPGAVGASEGEDGPDGDELGDESGPGPTIASDGEGAGAAKDGEASKAAAADGLEEPGMGASEPGKPEETSPFLEEEADLSEADFEQALGKALTEIATKAMKREPYRVFTTDFDRVELYEPRTSDAGRIERMDDAVKHMIGPMQKDLDRLMAARSQRLRVPGFRSGRLDASNLHRLSLADDRVFRRVHEMKAKNTAVTLLIDLSGSMSRPRQKIETAAQAAYAVSLTLDRLAVPHEVLGFTTCGIKPEQYQAIAEEQSRIGKRFTRYERIYMPIFKQFQERFNPIVKRRFAEMATNISLSENIDGESVMMAARRLALRTEERKVLMVFSDGNPACQTTDWQALNDHLKTVVADVEKSGIETIGIGIQSRAVEGFYPKHVVLNNVADLPKAVMGELKKVLLAA